MLDWLRFALGAVLMLGGLFVLLSGVLGLFRFRFSLSRIHAGALIDTIGILLTLGGLIVALGFTLTSLKLLVVIAFLWCTSPVASHLIGRLEVTVTEKPERSMAVEDPEAVAQVKEEG